MVYGNFETAGGHRGAPARIRSASTARSKVAGEKMVDRLQAGLRPAVHDHPAVGALRAALRQPARRPDLHREGARAAAAARRRRRRRAARLHLHRRPRRRPLPRPRASRRARTRCSTSPTARRGRSPSWSRCSKNALSRRRGRVRGARQLMPFRGTLSVDKARRLIRLSSRNSRSRTASRSTWRGIASGGRRQVIIHPDSWLSESLRDRRSR